MKKILLCDLDGVLLLGQKIFSKRLSKEYDVEYEKILEFISGPFQSCLIGKKDLLEELELWKEKWNWNGTAKELLEYWLNDSSYINKELKAILEKIQEKGIKCYVATNQEKYRFEYLKKTFELEKYFEGFFVSSQLNFKKTEKEFFDEVLKKLNSKAEEVLFIDDDLKNIELAKLSNIQSIHFQSNEDIKLITSYISS